MKKKILSDTLLQIFRTRKRFVFGISISLILETVISLGLPGILSRIIDGLGKQTITWLVAFILFFLAIVVVKGFATVLNSYLSEKMGRSVCDEIRKELLKKLFQFSVSQHKMSKTGDFFEKIEHLLLVYYHYLYGRNERISPYDYRDFPVKGYDLHDMTADELQALQADWENFRRRTANERIAERERATEKLVTALLPVVDDIERAIDHARSQELADDFKQFVDGVDAVHAKLLDVFAHEGVEPIDPKGEAFDPLEHQAVGRVEDASQYDETVNDVYQKGYRMADRILRSAMVTVTYGGEKRPAPEPEAAPEDATADTAESTEE